MYRTKAPRASARHWTYLGATAYIQPVYGYAGYAILQSSQRALFFTIWANSLDCLMVEKPWSDTMIKSVLSVSFAALDGQQYLFQ